MLRICKYCGKRYDGDPGGSCCTACAAEQRRTTLRERICTICGAKFQGGPAARYCPDCRIERRREASREFKQRRAMGNVRRIGSTSLCEICGKPFTVTGGLQRYCPDCAPEAIRAKDNAKSREWAAVHTTPEQRRAERQAASAPIPCAACGKLFVPTDSSLACSPACAVALHKQQLAHWESDHSEERKRYRRDRYAMKKQALTPEEYRAYREKINAKARENYARRKAKK